jgi:hypothetical protein
MFLQHDFNILGGNIEHLVSDDRGQTFVHHDTSLLSVPGGPEAGIYDPDPAEIDGTLYLTYSGMSVIGQPDLYLARSVSGTWDGPWERVGRILGHADVEYHNQVDDEDYEWGLEGPQLAALPNGMTVLTAVCFLADRPRCSRSPTRRRVRTPCSGRWWSRPTATARTATAALSCTVTGCTCSIRSAPAPVARGV